MPTLRSPNWNEQLGICMKHLIPQLPCPMCAHEKDPDVTAYFTEMEHDIAADERIPLSDLLPEDFAWVAKR